MPNLDRSSRSVVTPHGRKVWISAKNPGLSQNQLRSIGQLILPLALRRRQANHRRGEANSGELPEVGPCIGE